MTDEKFIFSLTLHHDQGTGEYVVRATAYEGTQSEDRFHTIDQAMDRLRMSINAAADAGPTPGTN